MRLIFRKNLILWGLICFAPLSYAQTIDNNYEEDEPPAIGNFILPSSQQPATLVGFGRNLLEAGQTQLFLYPDYFGGTNNHYADIAPSIVHGLSDRTSIFMEIPFATSYQDVNPATIEPAEIDEEGEVTPATIIPGQQTHSAGVEDTEIKLEHTFYYHSNRCYNEDASFVTSVTLPTGSSQKEPATGYGQPTLLLGATYTRTYADWFGFTSDGVRLPMPATHWNGNPNGEEFPHTYTAVSNGNEFLYQGGIGRNLFNIDRKWIIAFMVEGNGTYIQKTKENGVTDPNTGGNTLFVVPSLWASSKHLIFQLGVGVPVVQQLNGDQNKTRYLIVGGVGWTIT